MRIESVEKLISNNTNFSLDRFEQYTAKFVNKTGSYINVKISEVDSTIDDVTISLKQDGVNRTAPRGYEDYKDDINDDFKQIDAAIIIIDKIKKLREPIN